MGRTIVITGVTRGLGRALVDRFSEAGHTVCGCGRSGAAIEALGIIGDAAPCREVQELIAARLERVQRDLTHLNEVKQLLQRWMGFCRTDERTGRCGVHDRLDAPGKASLQDLTISLDPESRFKVHNEQWTCWSLLQSSHLPLLPGSRAL